MSEFAENWRLYLLEKYGTDVPSRITVDINELTFHVPPVMATTREGFKALEAHNRKVGLFN